MFSPKFLLFVLCVLCSLLIICNSFKLHLNRDVDGKADNEKIKNKPFASLKTRDEDISVEDSEEVSYVKEVKPKPIILPKLNVKTKPPPTSKAASEYLAKGSDENFEDDEESEEQHTFTHQKPQMRQKSERTDKVDRKLSKDETISSTKQEKVTEKTSKTDFKPAAKIDLETKNVSKTATVRNEDDKGKLKYKEVTKAHEKLDKTEKVNQKPKVETPAPQATKVKLQPKQEETKYKDQKPEKKEPVVKVVKEETKEREEKPYKTVDAKKPSEKEPSHQPKDDKNSVLLKEERQKQEGSGNGVNVEQEQFDVLYRSLPSFAPDYNIVKNAGCRREGQIFLRQLRGHKLWALQMLDASAKLPSGILRGNLNQLGDFDSCLDASARVKVHQDKPAVSVRGKYCLAEMDFAAVAEGARFPVHLLQARNFIRSNRKDPGHFIPKFTTINWALCLPSACTHEDAEEILLHAIAPYNLTTGLKITLDVKEDMCYTKRHVEWWTHSYETLATLGFYSFIIFIACFATLRDCWQSWIDVPKIGPDTELVSEEKKISTHEQNEGTLHRMFMAFSIKRSWEELFKSDSTEGDIECIHGIRALTTLILYSAHKLLPIARIPFSNRTYLTEIANSQWSVILRMSVIYTDTFLLLSGVLSAYKMSKDMMVKGEISWFKRLITRYMRLTPALLAVLLFYAYLWDHIGSGPQWTNVVTANARLCKDNMWMNMLYIQNFFPFEEMCATHTHQLALDMQLSILAPILVWFLYKRPIWGLALLGGFHSLSVGLRYFSTLNHRLSLVIFHGMSLSQLMRTANLLYANALHRATPYLTGIGLGVLLKNTGKNIHLPKLVVALGWMGALYFLGWTFNAPAHLAKRDYQYDVKEAAQFAASASVSWSLALSWLIFACHTSNGGSINSFLCSRPLVLLSRISYSFYLVQFIIFFYNVGTYRSSTVFEIMQSFDVVELLTIITAATVITLLIDTPIQVIKSVLLKSKNNGKASASEPEATVKSEEEIKQFIEEHEDYVHHVQELEQVQLTQRSSVAEGHQDRGNDEPVEEEDLHSDGTYDHNKSDLYDYEYDEEEDEDATDPNTEKEVGVEDDHDLQDWEWTEDNKQEENRES